MVSQHRSDSAPSIFFKCNQMSIHLMYWGVPCFHHRLLRHVNIIASEVKGNCSSLSVFFRRNGYIDRHRETVRGTNRSRERERESGFDKHFITNTRGLDTPLTSETTKLIFECFLCSHYEFTCTVCFWISFFSWIKSCLVSVKCSPIFPPLRRISRS